MTAPLTPEQEYHRHLGARLQVEFPLESARLDIAVLTFCLGNRTKERDEARAQLQQAIVRAEIAEAAADAAVQARWFTGTQKDADDALLNYELHHGRTVPGLPGRDGWDV